METNTKEVEPSDIKETNEEVPENEISAANINESLDDLASTALDIMNEIIRNKKHLEEVVKEGAIHLAKSRYILGSHSVSVSQLPSEETNPFSALCSVKVEYNSEHGVKVPTFTSIRESAKGRGADPLNWFGVLVPQDLRLAQTQFRSATDIAIELATLQGRLDAITTEYPQLKKISVKEE